MDGANGRLGDFLSSVLDRRLSRPSQTLIGCFVGSLVQLVCQFEHGFQAFAIHAAKDDVLYVIGATSGAAQSTLCVMDSRGQVVRRHQLHHLVVDLAMDAQGCIMHLLEWHQRDQSTCGRSVHAQQGFRTERCEVVDSQPMRLAIGDCQSGCLYFGFPRRCFPVEQPASILCRAVADTLVHAWQWPADEMAEIDDVCVTHQGTVLASGCLTLQQTDCWVSAFDAAAQFQYCWSTGSPRVRIQTERHSSTRTSLLSRLVLEDALNRVIVACGQHIGVFAMTGAPLLRFEHHAFVTALTVDAHHRMWVVCMDDATQCRMVEGLLIDWSNTVPCLQDDNRHCRVVESVEN